MEIDVIILSNTKDDSYLKMTNECIDSLLNSTDNHTFKIQLFESNKNASDEGLTYKQKEVITIVPDEDFNFNRFYNLGLQNCKNEFVLLINNDLIFEKNSIDNMLTAFTADSDLMSVSPWEPTCHKGKHRNPPSLIYGYKIRWHICGWAVMAKRKLYDIIGPYDEDFKFWYQDNDYAETLKKYEIKHALVRDSIVVHKEEASHKTIPRGKSSEFKKDLKIVFDNKWNTKKTKTLF